MPLVVSKVQELPNRDWLWEGMEITRPNSVTPNRDESVPNCVTVTLVRANCARMYAYRLYFG